MRAASRIKNMLMTLALTVLLMAVMLPVAGLPEVYGASSPLKSGTYTHDSRFDGHLVVNGVDVSYWQGTASNWTVAKRQGVEYAIMRVTYTGYAKGSHNYKNKDSHFTTHYKKARAAGIMTGAYVFSQARTVTEAKNEAKYAVKTLNEYGITPADLQLPLYMDYEYCGTSSTGRLYGVKASVAKKCAKAFCDVVRDAGYQPGIYANTNFFKSMLSNGSTLADDIDLWCAQYYNRNQSGSNYSKWQFSSTGTIGSGKKGLLYTPTGKVGSTDVNFWYIKRKPSSSGGNDIAGMAIYGATAYNYTGKLIRPELEIYDGSTRLKEGTDYSVGYVNNVQKGSQQAYVYIRGVGSYSGYALVPFTIGSGYIKHLGLISDGDDGYILTNAGVKDTYKLSSAISEDADEENDLVITEPAGGAKTETEPTTEPGSEAATETELGSESETETAQPLQSDAVVKSDEAVIPDETTDGITIAEDEISAETDDTVAADETAGDGFKAEGGVSEASMKAAASSSSDSLGLKIGKNKTSSYIRNIPPGTTVKKLLAGLAIRKGFQKKYSVAVISAKGVKQDESTVVKTGMLVGIYDASGDLAGTADLSVKGDNIKSKKGKDPVWGYADALSIKASGVSSLTGGPGSFTVKARKLSSSASNGYQLRYSLKQDMSGDKIVTISGSCSSVSKQVTGLKSGRTYYVQVRNVKKVNGYSYYSSWSTASSVTTQ